jgi:carbonic anhydrase/acetyltransferase-like protein (isoleucine patch superfamily)
MLIKHRDFKPVVDSSVFVAPTAVLVGRVHIAQRCRVMYGAVLDSEGSKAEIGECTIICENAVIRATASGNVDHPILIGDHVFIGPHATLLGCTVESCSYVATGATVLQGATVHSGAVVAVGALVHAGTVVPREFFVPPNTIAIGDPIKLYGPGEIGDLTNAIKSIGFAEIAFGVDPRGKDRHLIYKQVTEVRSEEFGTHLEDVVL